MVGIDGDYELLANLSWSSSKPAKICFVEIGFIVYRLGWLIEREAVIVRLMVGRNLWNLFSQTI